MTAERNFFHRWWGSSTIGSDTNAIWGMSAKSEPVQLENALHMGEGHLDFLAFIAGAFEGGRVSQGSDIVSKALSR